MGRVTVMTGVREREREKEKEKGVGGESLVLQYVAPTLPLPEAVKTERLRLPREKEKPVIMPMTFDLTALTQRKETTPHSLTQFYTTPLHLSPLPTELEEVGDQLLSV